mmetsp:Transcript_123732/g.395934  ORF Transcript_123732/g.395934 Transcript_123732/m.395934 type:complete len:289 (-) Transcript_123732:946-1812(-)
MAVIKQAPLCRLVHGARRSQMGEDAVGGSMAPGDALADRFGGRSEGPRRCLPGILPAGEAPVRLKGPGRRPQRARWALARLHPQGGASDLAPGSRRPGPAHATVLDRSGPDRGGCELAWLLLQELVPGGHPLDRRPHVFLPPALRAHFRALADDLPGREAPGASGGAAQAAAAAGQPLQVPSRSVASGCVEAGSELRLRAPCRGARRGALRAAGSATRAVRSRGDGGRGGDGERLWREEPRRPPQVPCRDDEPQGEGPPAERCERAIVGALRGGLRGPGLGGCDGGRG